MANVSKIVAKIQSGWPGIAPADETPSEKAEREAALQKLIAEKTQERERKEEKARKGRRYGGTVQGF